MTAQRWRPNKKVAAGIPIFFLLLSVGMCTVGASKPAKSNTEVHMGIHPTDADFRENLILLGSEHGDYQNAVAWFKHQGKQVGPLLMAALQEGRITPLQRGRIIETLGEIGEDKAIPMLVVTLGSGELSWEAAQALGRIGTRESEEALIQCLQDERLPIVKECTKALGYFHSDTALEALRVQLLHNDPSVRYYAVNALLKIRPAGLKEIVRIHLGTEQDSDVRNLIETLLE